MFAKLIRGATEVKWIGIDVTGYNRLQLNPDGRELRLGIISRPSRWFDPRVCFVGRRRDDQQCAPIHYVNKKSKPITYTQCFLLYPVNGFSARLSACASVTSRCNSADAVREGPFSIFTSGSTTHS